MLTFKMLQEQQAKWKKKNFPNSLPYQSLLGLLEELGELSHAHLKSEQGIRTDENHQAMKEDAVADIAIYLAGYCTDNGIDLEKCVKQTWSQVKKRNWNKPEQKKQVSDQYKIKRM